MYHILLEESVLRFLFQRRIHQTGSCQPRLIGGRQPNLYWWENANETLCKNPFQPKIIGRKGRGSKQFIAIASIVHSLKFRRKKERKTTSRAVVDICSRRFCCPNNQGGVAIVFLFSNWKLVLKKELFKAAWWSDVKVVKLYKLCCSRIHFEQKKRTLGELIMLMTV